jgi:hypothetical protein
VKTTVLSLSCEDVRALRVLALSPVHTLDWEKVHHLRAAGLVDVVPRYDLGYGVAEYRITDEGRVTLQAAIRIGIPS